MTSSSGFSASPRLRVVAVDDDTVIREGLPLLIPGFEVVAVFADVESFLMDPPPTDVVLLDLKLDGTGPGGFMRGVAAVQAVAAAHRVLVYTNERRRIVLASCLTDGARGVVHKAEPVEALASAITEIAEGRIVITQALTGLAELVERRGALPGLSPRERQVLAGRARGESFRSIAARLYVSEKTAAGYMDQVKAKFADYLRTRSPHGEFKVPRTPFDLHVRGPTGTRRDGRLKHSEGCRGGPRTATCADTWGDGPGHRLTRRSRARGGSERAGQRPAADFELAVPFPRGPRVQPGARTPRSARPIPRLGNPVTAGPPQVTPSPDRPVDVLRHVRGVTVVLGRDGTVQGRSCRWPPDPGSGPGAPR